MLPVHDLVPPVHDLFPLYELSFLSFPFLSFPFLSFPFLVLRSILLSFSFVLFLNSLLCSIPLYISFSVISFCFLLFPFLSFPFLVLRFILLFVVVMSFLFFICSLLCSIPLSVVLFVFALLIILPICRVFLDEHHFRFVFHLHLVFHCVSIHSAFISVQSSVTFISVCCVTFSLSFATFR